MEQPPNSPSRILLVDDDEDDFYIIRHLVANIPDAPFSLDWSDSYDDALSRIRQKEHDIYLIDYRLGANTGLELLNELDLANRVEPFIILTGAGDERVERQAMKMGVADYLVKGTFDSDLLSRVLRHSIQRRHMEVQRVQQLIDLNRSKDEFIALASHQLRTPATAVKQYVSMVMEGYAGPINEDQTALLQSAFDGNERQLQIVNDILRVAKLDLEKIILEKQEINAIRKMKNVMSDILPQIHERRQLVTTNFPDKPVMVSIDPEYMRMALSNILDNASKYTEEGKSIHVSVAKNTKHVAITIRDEGVGIAEEDMDKLFRKFSRIDNPLSVKVGGTGLGLYWTQEIVQLHGGSITVDSSLEKGTAFSVLLPTP